MNTKAEFHKAGDVVDYTNAGETAIVAGDPIEVGEGLNGIAVSDIAVGGSGSVRIAGIVKIVCDNSEGVAGALVGWDINGSPVGGVATSGAATVTGGSMDFELGRLVSAKVAADTVCYVKLGTAMATTAEATAIAG